MYTSPLGRLRGPLSRWGLKKLANKGIDFILAQGACLRSLLEGLGEMDYFVSTKLKTKRRGAMPNSITPGET